MPDGNKLYSAIIEGDLETTEDLTKEALAGNIDPSDVLENQLLPAMGEVGRRFESNEFFIPELLISARAMKGAMKLITPRLAEAGVDLPGRIAIGTVQGDLHDIGKNLVAAMLEGNGFQVLDLGVDVPPERFVQAVREDQVQIVALSALLTTTMPSMRSVMESLANEGLREKVKVMIGGAPINRQYANDIGADGFSENASGAVTTAKELLEI